MKDYFRESVRRDIPNWGKVNHCKNHHMYVNTRLSWEGRLTRKSLDFDFQLNLDDHIDQPRGDFHEKVDSFFLSIIQGQR